MTHSMQNEPGKRQTELFPLDIIRTETVLSRNPIHNLSTGKPIEIAIQVADPAGKTTLQWQVSYNSRYGQPGRLAYKVDTLVVNRRIEEAERPIPKLLRLGSLRDICSELGVNEGKATQDVKKALLQNASAFINAKLNYTGQDGTEYDFEFGATRYDVIFTGKKLPDGRKANAVFLVLHDTFRSLLDRAPVRPLNYDYLRGLPPIAQRFYELVSYPIYGTIRHGRDTVRYHYSEFCTYAPQTRYYDWEHVRKQMYKVHKPHLTAEYLAKVECEETTDAEGQPDWCFWYTPGARAYAEYNGFVSRRQPRSKAVEIHRSSRSAASRAATPRPPAPALPLGEPASPEAAAESQPAADPELVSALVANELNRGDAERLARDKPEECRRQLTYLESVKEFKSSRGAYLRTAIEQGFGPPKGHTTRVQKEQVKNRQAEEAARKEARQGHEKAHQATYLAWVGERVGELEQSRPEVAAGFREAEERTLQGYRRTLASSPTALRAVLADFEKPASRLERLQEFLQKKHPDLKLPDFWHWDAAHNPQRFKGPDTR